MVRPFGLNLTNSVVGPIDAMSNITKFSGKITFYWYEIKVTTDNGIDIAYTLNPGWDLGADGHTLVLVGITPAIRQKDGVFLSIHSFNLYQIKSTFN